MISIDEAIKIHQILIQEFGGVTGVRDMPLLESAILRPLQTFDGKLLYPEITDQAAAVVESLITNHPFQDGNKRIGYTIMRLHLLLNNLDIEASEDEKYEFVISIASGTMSFEKIKSWIKERIFSL